MKSRIGLQLILAVAAVSLTVFALLSNFLINSQHRSLVTQMGQHAEQITETIKRSTRYAMLRNRRDDVHQIIDAIGEQEEFTKVRIFNKEGEIIYSPDTSALGTMVDKRAEACYACHEADLPLERLSTSRRTRYFTDSDKRPYLGIINPIYNEPSCSRADCHAHPASQSVLGVLDVTMSLDKIQQQMTANRRKAILLTALAIFSTSAIILLLHHQLVGKPVRQLLQATERVADGDLTHRIEVKRDNELGKLQSSFNEMTRRLSEAQNQLYQSDKMASVGRLAAGIAHEINNPLTGVLSFSSLLLKNATEGSESQADLEIVVRETKRCREIVKGLLDFSRQVPPRKTNVNLNETVKRALEIVDHQLAVKNIAVTTTMREDLPSARVDSNQIVQVLINLLVNAADAIGPQGGEIFLSTDLEEIEGNQMVELKVADTGCGIPLSEQDKIFEPFFSTKEGKGTGLGLAVVWGIINEHDGSISVTSQPERGSTFTILLPINVRMELSDKSHDNERRA